MGPADRSVIVLVRAPLDAARAAALAELVETVAGGPAPSRVVCHVSGTPDLQTLETMARLHMMARRAGAQLTVRGSEDLLDLLTLAGLAGVLTAD